MAKKKKNPQALSQNEEKLLSQLSPFISFTSAPTMIEGSIQDAISAAKAGDVLHIPPGSYPCHLVIDKDLTLIGHDCTLTPLDRAAERTFHAKRIEVLKKLYNKLVAAKQEGDAAEKAYQQANSLVFWTKTRLRKELEAAESEYNKIHKEYKKKLFSLQGVVDKQMIYIKKAKVTMKVTF